jgi:hypothetical protein
MDISPENGVVKLGMFEVKVVDGTEAFVKLRLLLQ